MTPERFDQIRGQCEAGETPHAHIVEECLEEIARLAKIAYVPGGWFCPKCGFQLTKSVLYAKSGNVGIDYQNAEPCPNDGEAMLPQTWESDARAMAETIPDAIAMGMIHDLRKNQGAAVTIVCDNEDGTGEDNSAVEICDEWTEWTARRFYGKDVRNALWKARSAMYEATRGSA